MLYIWSIFLIRDVVFDFRYAIFCTVASFIITFVLVYVLYSFHAFGGADAKALIVLSILFPVYPEIHPFPLLGMPFIELFPLTILLNAILCTSIYLLYVYIKKDKRPIPFLIPITTGFLVAVIFGDLTYIMIKGVLTYGYN